MIPVNSIGFKIVKFLAHILCWGPFGWLFYAAANAQLGGDPQDEVLHQLGYWGMIFLLLSLTMTPLKKLITGVPWVRFRRMLGLYGAFYGLLHLTMFVVFHLQFSFAALWTEIVERPYITVGMLAILGLIPLAVTSTKYSQRKLGKNWKKLHWLVYPIIVLVLTHYIWQSKSDLNGPFIYLSWMIVLLGMRLYSYYKNKNHFA
ncbi:sulfoxide reductase heme-binding subunit YedZ [Aliikangiella marina]|uniref:Protein-methionine-sulfoxide reductase heme-binding subunit MsrQ n=1 Tax=Aliikangiella marina TaxID=1712262 RepID=A0A545TEK8_9GAMM|nr:protein-methionine-sulfoxide reductase heme-binding subunit MsrQ [Aliikangiella marina]TQV75606.1 sulfoxide reductase heme-binding subunit YedZ [Aliikangiella marina]